MSNSSTLRPYYSMSITLTTGGEDHGIPRLQHNGRTTCTVRVAVSVDTYLVYDRDNNHKMYLPAGTVEYFDFNEYSIINLAAVNEAGVGSLTIMTFEP